jgi:hypothetical protein
LALVCACKSDDAGGGFAGELQFEGTQDFLPGFEQDTGWLPADSPASVRVVAKGKGGITARARATTDGSSLTPVSGSGELVSEGKLVLEVSAKIDTAGVQFEDVVDSFSYAIDPGMESFEPFALDGEVTVKSKLPRSELASVPIPGVPGATLTIDVAGGMLSTTFEGTCAEAAQRVGQVTGMTTTSGTIDLEATIEIDALIETLSFGPFPLTVEVPKLEGEIDLGALSLDTGEPVDDPLPCADGMDGDDDDDDDDDPEDDDKGDSASMSDSDPSAGSTTDDPIDTDPGTTGPETTSGTDGETSSGETTGGGECSPADECQSEGDCGVGGDCSFVCTCYDVVDCDNCVAEAQSPGGPCETETNVCAANEECVAFSVCLGECEDSDCGSECAEDHPDGVDDYLALYTCVLGDDGVGGACGPTCS